jgi:sugar O-acyltransferase (sialic acid O-acetyltransferase NeuD family)
VIFGTGKIAEVATDCFSRQSNYKIVGYCVDNAYYEKQQFLGKPVSRLSDMERLFPIGSCDVFVALGYQDINRIRTSKVLYFREKGYHLASYIDSSIALYPSIEIGEHNFIMEGVTLQPYCKITDNNFLWSQSIIGHHVTIGSNNWLTSSSKIAGNSHVGNNNLLAIGATVGNSLTIGNYCLLGANSLVTKDLADDSVMIEQPTIKFRLTIDDFLKISDMK